MSTFICLTAGWSSQVCPKIINVIMNVSKNHMKKHPHFAEQPFWHHKCDKKSCYKMSTFCWTAGWTSQMCPKIMWQTVHILFQERMDMMLQSILRRVDVMSHVTNHLPRSWGGLKKVDKKYMGGSYRCKNVAGANCNSRRFIGWMDSVGQIVAW